MRVFAWIIPILDLLGNTFYWLNIFSSSPKFHATYFVRSLLLCVNSSIDSLLSIYLHSSFPHAFHHWHMVLFIFFVANKMLNEQKKMRWKSWWLYNIFIKRRTKGVRCKNSYITGEWLSQLTTTHMHTHRQRHSQAAVCSNTQRWTTEISVLFDICNDKIQPNERAPRLLAGSVARSFVRSLALFTKSFDSGRPHIYNEQFYLFAILFIHVKRLYVATHYIVAFHFGRPTTHSNYFRV